MIPLARPNITDEDIQAVSEVLRSGHLVQGQKVRQFEKSVSSYVGTKYAVAVSSGTAALHLALLSLDLREGDIVLIPAYSFPATANAVILAGGNPKFIDIDPDTFNLDVNTLNTVLMNSGFRRRVKAIMPVHCFGLMADMDRICSIASRWGIAVIEDAACALGASLDGQKAGSWGLASCFSFHPLKIITTGEGGMITTNDQNIVSLVRAWRDHGREFGDFSFAGYNYRMTEFQAALGLSQMGRLVDIIAKRRNIASMYESLFVGTCVDTPKRQPGYGPTYQSYVVKVPSKREKVRAILKEKGIETSVGTWDIPSTKFYHEADFGLSCYDAKRMATRTIGLPIYHSLTQDEQQFIATTLLEAVNG